MTGNGFGVSLQNDENILKSDSGDCCNSVNIINTTKLYTLFKSVNFTVYVNYISKQRFFFFFKKREIKERKMQKLTEKKFDKRSVCDPHM